MKSKATVALFCFLLVIRFTDTPVFNKMFNFEIPSWFMYLYTITVYAVIVALIWLNRGHLQSMNIDRWFIVSIISVGVFLFLFYLPPSLGIVVLLLTAFVAWSLKNAKLNLIVLNITRRRLLVYVFTSLIPIILLLLYNVLVGMRVNLSEQPILMIVIKANLLGIVFEEFLFRGILWMLLTDLKLNNRTILLSQALLFWIAHYQLLTSGSYYTFWVTLPFVSLFYGYIARQSKSISVTSLCHLSNNLVSVIISLSL